MTPVEIARGVAEDIRTHGKNRPDGKWEQENRRLRGPGAKNGPCCLVVNPAVEAAPRSETDAYFEWLANKLDVERKNVLEKVMAAGAWSDRHTTDEVPAFLDRIVREG